MGYQPFPLDLISTNNSRNTTLLSGAVFTGTADDLSNYKEVAIAVFADQASATDGLQIQQSSDGTNWDIIDAYTVPASTGKVFTVGKRARYLRVVYTNGGTNQGVFRLQTTLLAFATNPSSVRPQDGRPNDNDMAEVISYAMEFNGTTWDRKNPAPSNSGTITTQNLVPAGTATANSAVELTLNGAGAVVVQVTGTYTGALSIQATLNGTTWVTLAGVPIINLNTGGSLAVITSALQSIFGVAVAGFLRMRVTGLAAMTGTATVTIKAVPAAFMTMIANALPTGANVIGAVTQSGTWTVQPGNTVNTTAWLTALRASTSGGLSQGKVVSAASTNATSLKATTGQIYGYEFTNRSATLAYVKFFNKASAPTVGTDVPTRIVAVPAGGRVQFTSTVGIPFSTGIAYCIINGATDYLDAGNTAVAAGDIIGSIDYF